MVLGPQWVNKQNSDCFVHIVAAVVIKKEIHRESLREDLFSFEANRVQAPH